MAVQRARDERLHLQNAGNMLPIEAAAAAERERARMVEAATRLAAEERAAAEALLKARLSDEEEAEPEPAAEAEPATIQIPEASATPPPVQDDAAETAPIDLRTEEVARTAAASTRRNAVVSAPVAGPAPTIHETSDGGLDLEGSDVHEPPVGGDWPEAAVPTPEDRAADDQPSHPAAARDDAMSLTRAAHRSRPQGRDRAVRISALALLPVAVVAKTVVTGAWWEQANWPLLAGGAVVAVAGVWWVWWATRPPRALLPAHRRGLHEDRVREMSQVTQARMLLARLAAGDATDEAWRDFEETSGLVVAGALRRTVHHDMDPGALARYVRNRQPVAPPRPASVESIAGIFVLLVCLPVLVIVLLA